MLSLLEVISVSGLSVVYIGVKILFEISLKLSFSLSFKTSTYCNLRLAKGVSLLKSR